MSRQFEGSDHALYNPLASEPPTCTLGLEWGRELTWVPSPRPSPHRMGRGCPSGRVRGERWPHPNSTGQDVCAWHSSFHSYAGVKPGRVLLEMGAEQCSDAQLLVILLGSGGRSYSALDSANALLDK